MPPVLAVLGDLPGAADHLAAVTEGTDEALTQLKWEEVGAVSNQLPHLSSIGGEISGHRCTG